jgi:D-xylose transport system ATP-binding protein
MATAAPLQASGIGMSMGTDQASARGEATAAPPLLSTRGLTKRFPGTVAVDGVDLLLRPGEIVALLGQNGAGKSTLIQILAGAFPHGSWEGAIEVEGGPFAPASVAAAEAAGVVLIPQEIAVLPDRSVAENMLLNAEPGRFGLVDPVATVAHAGAALRAFGVEADPRARMGDLDLATQQLATIARALAKRAKLLILDEATAALTEAEAQRLFERMRALRDRGVACVFVSHRLGEVFAVADRILVMRDGRLRGDHAVHQTTRAAVVAEMIGGAPVELAPVGRARPEVALRVDGLSVRDPGSPGRLRVDGLSFELHRGEVLGLFGLLGAGCGPAATALFGAWPGPVAGRVFVDGAPAALQTPAAAIAHGVGLVAQDRRAALVRDQSLASNVVLASLPAVSPRGWLDRDRTALVAREAVARLSIRAPSIDAPVGTLSGGNQQKVQVARWLAAGSRVLLLVDPTRGVDVGARAEIQRAWQGLAAEGYALLLVSSEAEELVEVCHRVIVMRRGRAVAEVRGADLAADRLLQAAAGV